MGALKVTYETKPNKSGRTESEKPALILLRDGKTIEAVHQFINTDRQLCVHLDTRQTGIDARINLDEITAVITSTDAAQEFGVDDASSLEVLA
jgi:hypothetical protein